MIIKVISTNGSPIEYLAICLFGFGMILLYSASATYHSVISSDRVIMKLKKLDHSMIFILIAGSYAPFCLISLNGFKGWILFGVEILIAVLGVSFKLIWFNCPMWLSTSIYVLMGWIAVFLMGPLKIALSTQGLSLLIIGGVFYTIGAVIYATKPNFLKSKNLGFHEIFHIFIMLGTLTHFLCVFKYVI